MSITEQNIQQILFANDRYRLADLLAPLEIDRLIQLLYVLINEHRYNLGRAKQMIVQDLEENKQIFGNLNLSELLDLDRLLDQIAKNQP